VKLAIFGWPVAHSRSPRMQLAALAAAGLADWTYDAVEVAPADFAAALERLRAIPWRGANVTIPHKEAAAAVADTLTDDARAMGAVNTIVCDNGRLSGHNTDASGFLDAAGDVRGATCAVLGAGGSARAVVYALAHGHAREVRVVSRRALPLPGAQRALRWQPESLRGCDLLVGCAPPEATPPALDALAPGARVIDLVYYRTSALAAAAAAAGCMYQDGLEMLVRQGARAFELWTGLVAPIDVMRKAAAGE
jgi:shikimate dehydrogenase